MYLREKMNYPLPGLTTLNKWASSLDIDRGFFHRPLEIMAIRAKGLTEMEKVVCLSFDEMSTQAKTEYDEKKDRVLGPFTKMQVIMARALFGSWKQPIFADFDFNMTVDTLKETASLLHQAGYTVAATVCDCGGPNLGLMKALNVTLSNTSFPHPITNEPIFFFADAPHLIKLFRNWLLRPEGILLGNGKTVTMKPLQELLKVTRSEINSMFKFTPRHLYLSTTEKQNVRTAVQLLSATVAQGLSDYVGSSKNSN